MMLLRREMAVADATAFSNPTGHQVAPRHVVVALLSTKIDGAGDTPCPSASPPRRREMLGVPFSLQNCVGTSMQEQD